MSASGWFLVVTLVTFVFARIVKAWPAVPKTLLPWIALAVGYVVTLGLGLREGLSFADAAVTAWQGLLAGLSAIGGHESLKPLLTKVFGEDFATFVLGKLPSPADPKKKG
jgi:hypothetical protein